MKPILLINIIFSFYYNRGGGGGGGSYFPFDYTMCKFITDLFFTNVGLVLAVCLSAKQIIHFRNDTEKKIFELLCSFLGFLFVSYT